MISIQKLDFAYWKQAHLFDKLSLELSPGSITGLLGKNGSGKTTLLKLIAGLLYPHSGNVSVAGNKPGDRRPSFLTDIYLVPEEFYLPSLSIKNYVKASSVFYPRFDRSLMEQLLGDFELSADRFISRLSYGQKKKFLISFALATKCRLLILDEPTNGLDIPSKAIFRKVMAGALDEDQLVVISTHQVKDVESLIDCIVILSDGKVILQKDMHDIASQLQFESTPSLDGDEVLYSEVSPRGYRVIRRQVNGNTSIDIELLFNAVTKGINLFHS